MTAARSSGPSAKAKANTAVNLYSPTGEKERDPEKVRDAEREREGGVGGNACAPIFFELDGAFPADVATGCSPCTIGADSDVLALMCVSVSCARAPFHREREALSGVRREIKVSCGTAIPLIFRGTESTQGKTDL